jgi:hypothetical protein
MVPSCQGPLIIRFGPPEEPAPGHVAGLGAPAQPSHFDPDVTEGQRPGGHAQPYRFDVAVAVLTFPTSCLVSYIV